MSEDDLVCREFVSLVTEWFDGTLSGARAADMAAHLCACQPCRIHYEQMRTTVMWLRSLRDTDPPMPTGATDANGVASDVLPD